MAASSQYPVPLGFGLWNLGFPRVSAGFLGIRFGSLELPIRDPALKKLSGNIRKKRKIRKLSQEALAEQADLDRTDIGSGEW